MDLIKEVMNTTEQHKWARVAKKTKRIVFVVGRVLELCVEFNWNIQFGSFPWLEDYCCESKHKRKKTKTGT